MPKRPAPSIRDQIRDALAAVFGRRRAPKKKKKAASTSAARRTYKKRPRGGAKDYVKPKRVTKPASAQAGKPKVCGVCGEPGHNARRHRGEAPSAPAAVVSPPDNAPVEPEAQVEREVASAGALDPHPVADPAEGGEAAGEVEAAGDVAGDVELAPATLAAPGAPRRRGPRHCGLCGDVGHDMRICPKRRGAGGDSAQEPSTLPEEPPPAPPVRTGPSEFGVVHDARVAEFRRLQAHFPLLDGRPRAVALLVAQGYDPAAIAGDLRIKRFDVYQLLDGITDVLRRAEKLSPTPEPAPPPVIRRPPPASVEIEKEEVLDPTLTQEHDEVGEDIEDEAPIFLPKGGSERTELKKTGADPQSAKVASGCGRGPRHCRRCGQPGHRRTTCPLDDSDLVGARLQDIAAACVRLGLTPPAPPPAIPVRADLPVAVAARVPTWTREDLDAIAELVPDRPEEAAAPVLEKPAAPAEIAVADQPDAVPLPDVGDTALERARRKMRVLDGRVRASTVSSHRLTQGERQLAPFLEAPEDVQRPLTRGDCEEDKGRPCPWVCRYNNWIDINEETGAIKFNYPHLEMHEMPAEKSCSLDVADRGGITLDDVGAIVNLTRERIRQLEVRGLTKIKEYCRRHKIDLGFFVNDRGSPLAEAIG